MNSPTQQKPRLLVLSAFVLASTTSLAAYAAPDGGGSATHRTLVRQHIDAHNEQGDVQPMTEPRNGCRRGSPWFGGIGYLQWGSDSEALGVSPDGHIVVGYSTGVDPVTGSLAYRHAVAWNGCHGLTTLPGTPLAASWSMAHSISNSGRHVAGITGLDFDSGTLWLNNSDGVERLWNPEHSYFQRTVVTSVSADGASFAGSAQDQNGTEAFVYHINDAAASMLGDLPGGEAFSEANAISHNSNAVVGRSASANGIEAFVWYPGVGMIGLGDLPGGFFESTATAVSANGSVVVGFAQSDQGREAFRWTAETGMVGLGSLGGFSEAFAVSGDGQVVIGRSLSGRGEEAFIWTEATGMRSLRDVAIGLLPQEFSFWQLTAARGISADGVVIVGAGINPQGYYEGWVMELSRDCPADWNDDGDLNSADFFSFLTAFFGGNADYTGDGLTNTQDFFEFLTRFFGGC